MENILVSGSISYDFWMNGLQIIWRDQNNMEFMDIVSRCNVLARGILDIANDMKVKHQRTKFIALRILCHYHHVRQSSPSKTPIDPLIVLILCVNIAMKFHEERFHNIPNLAGLYFQRNKEKKVTPLDFERLKVRFKRRELELLRTIEFKVNYVVLPDFVNFFLSCFWEIPTPPELDRRKNEDRLTDAISSFTIALYCVPEFRFLEDRIELVAASVIYSASVLIKEDEEEEEEEEENFLEETPLLLWLVRLSGHSEGKIEECSERMINAVRERFGDEEEEEEEEM